MYTSPLLKGQQGIVHAFSGVVDGNMDYRFGAHDSVVANRSKLLIGMELSLSDCVQQFGMTSNIHVVKDSDIGHGMLSLDDRIETTALITNKTHVGLFLAIADCLPVIIFDPVRSVVALVHAARESTNGQITAKVVHRLAEEFGSKPSDLLVAFGPAIRAESYVYDERIYKLVTAEWKPHLKPIGPGQIMVDNIGYNRAQLIASGVLDKHISDPGLDTGQNSEYYSHVRASKAGQPEGRLAAVVALR